MGPTTKKKPVLVLIPGSWHGPWCWDLVRPLLEAAGYETVSVSNPSVGVRDPPVMSHREDVDNIHRELESICGDAIAGEERKDVLLVGHSYGAFLATDAVEGWAKGGGGGGSSSSSVVGDGDAKGGRGGKREHGVVGCVFLAPSLGEKGTTVAEQIKETVPPWTCPVVSDHPLYVDMIAGHAYFFNDMTEAETAPYVAQLQPEAGPTFVSRIESVAWDHVPVTAVVAGKDLTIQTKYQEEAVQRLAGSSKFPWTIKRLDCAHGLMVSRPRENAAIILDAAARYTEEA